MNETEQILVSALNSLTVQERTEALHDIHCVGKELRETTEIVKKNLAEFDQAVRRERNPVYEMAVDQNRAYVENRSFRLRFLRAEMHNIGKAVDNMMNFLRNKLLHFGEDKVSRDICLSDLSEEEVGLLLSGIFHIQNDRDPMGRVIVYITGGTEMLEKCRPETLIRVAYYFYFNILSSIEAVQMKGIVLIVYDMSAPELRRQFVMPGLIFGLLAQAEQRSFPVRFSALHTCVRTGTTNMRILDTNVAAGARQLPQHLQARMRFHHGSNTELQHILSAFGIPIDSRPLNMDGSLRRESLNLWLYRHMAANESESLPALHSYASSTLSITTGIREKDILFGRGRLVQFHPGNVLYRNFLETHAEEHDSAPRKLRRKVAIGLTSQLIGSGLRFMQLVENRWSERNFEESVVKVSQFYRTLRRNRGRGSV
ncbi:unnamed protein product [Cylindrotheca closterium]|uniref:DUF6824 domain-containing protein n=1 Tax=Cylindrotheca closterium TaxID=2856 RepID=A0AAD2CTU2_9STRA|nr:unnamed protein product [Cylindrotheca closterium]